MESPHVQIGLIERAFDSISRLVLCLCLCCLCVPGCFVSLYAFSFEYAVHVISEVFLLKSERKENKFQLVLCLSQEIPA